MTPEQRAEDVIEYWWNQSDSTHRPTTEFIAAAIREAVAEEREACAKVAESDEGFSDSVVKQGIARRIRARGESCLTPS